MARAIWSGMVSFGLVSIPVKLQGAIELKSAPGQGTRFIIDLPLSVADRAAEPALS